MAKYRRLVIGTIASCVLLSLLLGQEVVAASGVCRFDEATLVFEGDPALQASCLLRHVGKWARVDSTPTVLPPTIASRVGQPVQIGREAMRDYLASVGMTEAGVGGDLDQPLSRARNNGAGQPEARYLVIHDTSAPWFGDADFPADIDTSNEVNKLQRYVGPESVAHIFINRRGDIRVGHGLGVPWRATKLETKLVGPPSKGLFIHVELVQPRRRDPAGGLRNDAIAPQPGFTPAQYERLALIYTVASLRAGTWLIPGFHAAIDEGISDAHDDPQHFDLTAFDGALQALLASIATQG